MKYSFALLAAASAVLASPVGVTKAIAPSGSAPSGFSSSYPGSFGIAVETIGNHISARQVVTQISDGQVQAPTSTKVVAPSSVKVSTKPTSSSHATTSASKYVLVTAISQIGDGQIQAPHSTTATATTHTTAVVVAPTTTTHAATTSTKPTTTVLTTSKSTAQTTTLTTIKSTVPTTAATSSHTTTVVTSASSKVTTSSQHTSSSKAASSVHTSSTKAASSARASSSKAASSAVSSHATSSRVTVSAVSTITDGQPQAATAIPVPAGSPNNLAACAHSNTLTLTLNNGVLKDARGWTGYIASNYQFQFDNPPQAGAIYTSGFSVGGNGSLALGSQVVWYECLSGGFYNLYSQSVAPQCQPITINVVHLVQC